MSDQEQEARLLEASAIMPPPTGLPGYIKGDEWGSFPDVKSDIILDLRHYHHQVRLQEFLPYSEALFTVPPSMGDPDPPTYYVAVFDVKGDYKFQPQGRGSLGMFSAPRGHLSEIAREYTTDTFIGFMSVIYNRRCRIPTMFLARMIWRLCKRFGASEQFASWMRERFEHENWNTLTTLHEHAALNIQLAEDIRYRRMYIECFILLAGQLTDLMHPGLIGNERNGLSKATREDLKFVHLAAYNHASHMLGQAGDLLQEFIRLMGDNNDIYTMFLIKRFREFCVKFQRSLARNRALYMELRGIVSSIATGTWLERAPEIQRYNQENLIRQINRMLECHLMFYERPGRYFTNLLPSRMPWEDQSS